MIEIARQDRPSLYDQLASRPEPLVRRAWRYEVTGRLAADGTELVPVDVSDLPELDPVVEHPAEREGSFGAARPDQLGQVAVVEQVRRLHARAQP